MLLVIFQALNFYIDPVVYCPLIELQDSISQAQVEVPNIFYIEFNCEIPYQELFYEEFEKTITAKTRINFKLINQAKTDSLIDSLARQFSIPSFSEAAREEISFIVQFGMFVPDGFFEYEVGVSSGDKNGIIKGEIAIKKENYQISDLLLASDIISDTTGSYLNKGNLKVIPRPSRVFTALDPNLYVYYEIYEPMTNKLIAVYTITDKDNKLIRKVSQSVEKTLKSQAVNAGLNIQNIPPGKYIFRVEICDSSTNASIRKEVPFEIIRKVAKEVSYEGLPYYEEIEYFVSSEQYKNFQALSKEGKAIFLKKFWNKHNYYEIAERLGYAKEHYSEGDKLGYKTDRGRIHVKFGEPDEKEKSTIEIEQSRPYEHWQYYNGLEFIFIDIRGTSEYTLVWTNARGERCQPSLYNYLPLTKRREIEQE